MTQTATIPAPATDRYRCEQVTPGDRDAIRGLLEQAMPGRVSFAMTHGPDHRAAVRLASERVDEVVVRDRSKHRPGVVGYGYRAVRPVYINGRVARVGYLGGLRCEPALRSAFRVLGRAFEALAERRAPGERPYDLTSIMADNAVVRRGLEKGLPGLPVYAPVGEMATLTIDAARHGRTDPRLRPAQHADTEAIDALLDATGRRYQGRHAWQGVPHGNPIASDLPAIDDYLILAQGGTAHGCIALWDQRRLKQIVIAGLSPALRRSRHAINLAARITGRPRLPGPGQALDMAYASHASFDLDDGGSASALIAGACALAAKRGVRLVSIGLPADAPILQYLTQRFSPWVSRSVIYAVSQQPGSVDLDERPVWMEIATL